MKIQELAEKTGLTAHIICFRHSQKDIYQIQEFLLIIRKSLVFLPGSQNYFSQIVQYIFI